MHLNQVVFIGVLALSLLLINLIQKYYNIYKKNYRISNLIILKLLLRMVLVVILTLTLYHEYTIDENANKRGGKNLVFLIPKSTINELSEDLRIQVNDIANSDYFNKIGLARLSDDKLQVMKVIPSTSKDVFFTLFSSPNLELTINDLKYSDDVNYQVNEYYDLSSNEFLRSKSIILTSNSNLVSSLYNNPAIKYYLLILSIILVSFDLVIKVKTIKL